MRWQDQLRYKYNMAGVLEKLIAVNVLIFVLQFFLQTLGVLKQMGIHFSLVYKQSFLYYKLDITKTVVRHY